MSPNKSSSREPGAPLAESTLAAESSAAAQVWVAYCQSTGHPNGSAWQGVKRNNRREAIKDAVNHNRQFGHQAEVAGPLD